MYYSHFGLSQAPFKITPNTEFFFSGGNRGPILEALIYAITHGEGIIKVTGEVGSGKTMLCHMLPRRLPPHVDTVYIANPSVSPEEILHTIAFELQLPVDRGASRLEVMQALHDFLLKRYAEGKRVVVFVEESQSMPLATLEEIRLLSNLEAKNDKLLQIVLFGQPELDDNLRQPQTRPLRERITHSFRLEPLAPGEIREYLMFRMRAAGYRGPDLFSGSVVGGIARASLGLTRRVNLIADKALLAAFSENTHTIRPKHVDAAVRDSEFSQQPHHRARPRYWWGAALVVGGAALGVAVYVLLQSAVGRPAPALGAAQPAPAAAAARPAPAQASAAPRPAAKPATTAAAQPAAVAASGNASTATVARAPEQPRSTAPAGADLVEERITATREWLANEALTTYSIQLFGANDPEQLRMHLNDLAKFIEMNKVFVYRTLAKQKPSLTVLYGSFGDRRAAQQALERLPESLKANQPILRTVNGIRTEIRQHEAS
jgi:type II secretory pathway predicted ATPase ExeA